MASSVIVKIAAKEVILMLIGVVFTSCLLKITFIRKLLGLPIEKKHQKNLRILLVSLTGGFAAWIIFVIFNRIFISQSFPQVHFFLESPYEMISLVVCMYLAIIIANLAMEASENRSQIMEALRASELQLNSISNNLHTGMIYQYALLPNGTRKIIYLSNSVEQLYSITPALAYENSQLLFSKIHPDDKKIYLQAEKTAIEESIALNCEVRIAEQAGEYRWSSLTASPQKRADGSVLWNGIELIITKQKEKQMHIEYLSFHDHLTGVYNRRFYEIEIVRIDKEKNLPISLLMADVNGLKLINDSFGHKMGDKILKKVSEIMTKACRDKDVISRLGGDEFAILLPQTDNFTVAEIMKRIKEYALAEKIGSIDLNMSFGYATKNEMEENMQEIFKMAEDHMHSHKLYESSSMRNKTIKLIMQTLYEKSQREMLHSQRVENICEAIAAELGFDRDDINQLKVAGLMHDIGKMGIDEKILNKATSLNEHEWKEMKKHSEIGYRILSSTNEYAEIADFVLEHEERWDGQGYPRQLKGEEISVQARIIAIADAYDAMTSDRAYRKGLSVAEAIKELGRCAGTQFDPALTKVFTEQIVKNLVK